MKRTPSRGDTVGRRRVWGLLSQPKRRPQPPQLLEESLPDSPGAGVTTGLEFLSSIPGRCAVSQAGARPGGLWPSPTVWSPQEPLTPNLRVESQLIHGLRPAVSNGGACLRHQSLMS